MAIGDDAKSVGYSLVPDTGEEGRVRWGARELNRTRDFIAQVKKLLPTSEAGARSQAGITSGTADPVASAGKDGDIYFKIMP